MDGFDSVDAKVIMASACRSNFFLVVNGFMSPSQKAL